MTTIVERGLVPDPIIEDINKLSQKEMARLVRFAPLGHIYFDSSKPYHAVFKERFKNLGGFTPEISKKIGW